MALTIDGVLIQSASTFQGNVVVKNTSTGALDVQNAAGTSIFKVDTSTPAIVIGANLTGDVTFTGRLVVSNNAAADFSVGPNGLTNPCFTVNAATANAVTGLQVLGLATGGGINLNAIDSGSDASINLRPKGAGNVTVIASAKVLAASGVIGFSVVSTSYTLGSGGTVILPNVNMSGAANDAARDVLAGNIDGAIAIDTGVAGRIYVRDAGVWKFALAT